MLAKTRALPRATATAARLFSSGAGDDGDDKGWGRRQFNYQNKASVTNHEAAFGSQATLEAVSQDVRSITSCGLKTFRVNGVLVRGPVLVTRTLCFEWRVQGGELATAKDLQIEDFEILTKMTPPVSLIILGTGAMVDYPSPELMKKIRDIAPVEVNDSLSGAGLFNILNKEDRCVAACMLPIHAWVETKKWIRD